MYYFLVPKYINRRGILPYSDSANTYKRTECKKCGAITVKYNEPVTFEIKGAPCDYYLFDNLLFVSERFLQFLINNNIKGYSVRQANSGTEQIYHELIIEGRCGYLKNLNGESLERCPECGDRIHFNGVFTEGLSIDETLYDGSDIFAFNNLQTLPIVTEELKRKMIKSGLTNLNFKPIESKIIDERY